MSNEQAKLIQQVEDYVNKVCQAFITPSEIWKRVECRHAEGEDLGFLKMVDCTDNSYYFDITAMPLEIIGILIATIVSGGSTELEVTDFEQRRHIAQLFNEKRARYEQ